MSSNMDDLLDFGSSATPATRAVTPLGNPSLLTTQLLNVEQTGMPVQMIGNRIAGKVVASVYDMELARLIIAPEFEHLGEGDRYDTRELASLIESLRATNNRPIYPLIGLPTGKTVDINGEPEAQIAIYIGKRRLAALQSLKVPTAPVLIPQVDDVGQLMFFALGENEVRRSLTPLEQCDIARLLHKQYLYPLAEIAKNLRTASRQNEDDEVLDKSSISRMISVAEQPPAIRDYIAMKTLTMKHIRHLDTIADVQERILAARYAVQESLSASALNHLIIEAFPVHGLPRLRLVPPADPQGPIEKLVINAQLGLVDQPTVSPQPAYWKRQSPMLANPLRVSQTAAKRGVVLSGSRERPAVRVDSLGSKYFYEQLAANHEEDVSVLELEEALLADLEAVRKMMEAAGMFREDGKIRVATVVDAERDERQS